MQQAIGAPLSSGRRSAWHPTKITGLTHVAAMPVSICEVFPVRSDLHRCRVLVAHFIPFNGPTPLAPMSFRDATMSLMHNGCHGKPRLTSIDCPRDGWPCAYRAGLDRLPSSPHMVTRIFRRLASLLFQRSRRPGMISRFSDVVGGVRLIGDLWRSLAPDKYPLSPNSSAALSRFAPVQHIRGVMFHRPSTVSFKPWPLKFASDSSSSGVGRRPLSASRGPGSFS